MYKFFLIFALAVISISAEPKAQLLAAAPVPIAPAVVTATSSQVIARNYNALAAPLVAAPVAVASYLASPYAPLPYVASAYSAPLIVA